MKNRLDDPEKQISKVEKELGHLSWDAREKKKGQRDDSYERQTCRRAEVQMLEVIS